MLNSMGTPAFYSDPSALYLANHPKSHSPNCQPPDFNDKESRGKATNDTASYRNTRALAHRHHQASELQRPLLMLLEGLSSLLRASSLSAASEKKGGKENARIGKKKTAPKQISN